MTDPVSTFCRVCESSCGLVAERENGEIIRVRPDKSHPVTQGYACPKGILSLDMHRDEDRLNYPLKRLNPRSEAIGRFDRISWDQSASEIAKRLQEAVRKYGPGAQAVFIGNPTAFNSLVSPAIASFCRQTGCRKTFSSGTQDCTNKFAAGEAVYGTSTLHPIPDIDHADYLLIIGENPRISHMSFISISDPVAKLKAAKARGAMICFVNPRHIECADGAGEVVQIKPDTDVYFLAALLHEINHMGGFRKDILETHGKNADGLIRFIEKFPPDRAETVVGIPASRIIAIARDFSRAEKAAVHMSTGVNMGRQGTLAYWLVQMLSFVTGNLDKKGGNLYSPGFYPAAKSGRTTDENPFFESPFGPMRTITGNLPGNLMADMILDDKDPIRSLVVISGNPLLSIGGEDQIRRAFETLELLVVLDIYRNATGEMADFVLPCADMLERPDVNTCGLGMQHRPYVQYTEAVINPRFERREQWWILSRIIQEMGLDSVLNDKTYNPFGRIEKMLSYAGLSIDRLKTLPSHTAVLPEAEPGRFYTEWLQTKDNKVDCCPALFNEFLKESQNVFLELQQEPVDQLKLISLRNGFMHNSWYHNIRKLKKGDHRSNALYLNSREAGLRGLESGSRIRMFNRWGSVDASVLLDDRLRDGVVAMTHGWGNEKTPGMTVAQQYPGVNVNRLLPSGPGSYERLSNQAHMTGVPVEIEKI
jgi:anaerobic selenocysteine-containing dehydrogenase